MGQGINTEERRPRTEKGQGRKRGRNKERKAVVVEEESDAGYHKY